MRKAKIGNREIELKASPLALFYYNQEFDENMLETIIDFAIDGPKNIKSLNVVSLLQLAWAMNKAAKYDSGETFPDFESWLAGIDNVSFKNRDWHIKVAEEASDGFFRSETEKAGDEEED